LERLRVVVPEWLRETEERDEYSDLYRIGLAATTMRLADDNIDEVRRHVRIAEARSSGDAFYVRQRARLAHASVELYGDDRRAAWQRVGPAGSAVTRLISPRWIRINTAELRGRAALAAATASVGSARRRLRAQVDVAAAQIEHEGITSARPLATLLR